MSNRVVPFNDQFLNDLKDMVSQMYDIPLEHRIELEKASSLSVSVRDGKANIRYVVDGVKTSVTLKAK